MKSPIQLDQNTTEIDYPEVPHNSNPQEKNNDSARRYPRRMRNPVRRYGIDEFV